MVLKGLRETPQVAEPVKRKKLAQQMSTSTSSKSPLTSIITSSGRHCTALRPESPDIGDSSASKKRYEKRVKVACSTCGKSIARKAEDAGQETFSACTCSAKLSSDSSYASYRTTVPKLRSGCSESSRSSPRCGCGGATTSENESRRCAPIIPSQSSICSAPARHFTVAQRWAGFFQLLLPSASTSPTASCRRLLTLCYNTYSWS